MKLSEFKNGDAIDLLADMKSISKASVWVILIPTFGAFTPTGIRTCTDTAPGTPK